MIGIVIPLKSKKVSRDWAVTIGCLEKTIASLTAQTNNSFRAVIVGHDIPFENFEDSKEIKFITVDNIEPPVRTGNVNDDQMAFERDRCTKILKGIQYLQKNNFGEIDFWFSLDADDLIRNDFVDFFERKDKSRSYILSGGFSLFYRDNSLYTEHEFYKYCGSSLILSNNLVENDITCEKYFYDSIPFTCASHVNVDQYFDSKSISYEYIAEPLACYLRASGDNISDEAYRKSTSEKIKMILKKLIGKLTNSRELKRFIK